MSIAPTRGTHRSTSCKVVVLVVVGHCGIQDRVDDTEETHLVGGHELLQASFQFDIACMVGDKDVNPPCLEKLDGPAKEYGDDCLCHCGDATASEGTEALAATEFD